MKVDINSWGKFQLDSLFDIVKGTRLTKKDMIDGDIRYIGASAINNGVTKYISNNTNLHSGNALTINYNGSVGKTYYQKEQFWASDDVNVLYPKFPLNKDIALFIAPIIEKSGQKYQFTNKWKLEDMKATIIPLPVDTSGNPDWTYMENQTKQLRQEVSFMLDCLSDV